MKIIKSLVTLLFLSCSTLILASQDHLFDSSRVVVLRTLQNKPELNGKVALLLKRKDGSDLTKGKQIGVLIYTGSRDLNTAFKKVWVSPSNTTEFSRAQGNKKASEQGKMGDKGSFALSKNLAEIMMPVAAGEITDEATLFTKEQQARLLAFHIMLNYGMDETERNRSLRTICKDVQRSQGFYNNKNYGRELAILISGAWHRMGAFWER
jgi:hypothetical protein